MKISNILLTIMVLLAACYFGYEIIFVLPKLSGFGVLTLNYLLIGCEILCTVFSIYLYHSVFCAIEWKSPEYKKLKRYPFVSLQIPVFNESMNVLKKTLKAALNQDYPKNRYEIIVADDTYDKRKVKSLKEFCDKHKIKYFHRNNRRGFKAGALNDILIYSRGEFIALLDADDRPEPEFLSHTVSVISKNPKIAVVQTRNAERNENYNTVTAIGRMMRDLFFGAIQKSKDTRKLGIFCGSGGIIRKNVLEECGNWPENTVTEDIDITTFLLAKGYYTAFANPIKCRGLLSPTFTGFTNQTFRWAHGTTRTFLLRWRIILKIPGFWRKVEHFLSTLTYLLGPSMLLIDLFLIIHLITKVPIFHMHEARTVWVFGLFFALSALFSLFYVQLKDNRIELKRIITYIFVMYGLAVNFTLAVISAIFNFKISFFRTPRSKGKKDYMQIMKRFWIETLIGFVSIYSGLINISNPTYAPQASWVIFFGIGFLIAPALAIKYG